MTFTVHEASAPPADRVDRADALEFVKDGFSWLTAIFPPLGFAGQSLWLPLTAYAVGVSALVAGLGAVALDPAWISLIVTALNIYLGFELSTIKRWSLDQDGWRMLGTVTGKNLDECERRFMESWLPSQPTMTTSRDGAAGAMPSSSTGFNTGFGSGSGSDPRHHLHRGLAAATRMWPFGAKR